MKPLVFGTIAFSCLLFSGCSMTSINYDFDTDFDFSVLKHYSWLDIPDDFPSSEITVQRIKRAVDQQLLAKEFEQESESPDFLISLQGFKDIIREGVERGTVYRGYGRGYDRRIDVYEYEEGTLIVTIINADNNNLIWEGRVTGIVEHNRSTEAKEKRTQQVVAKLLENFPPVKKQ